MPKEKTGFDMGNRVETELLDDFDGVVIKAGFMDGHISADRSQSGKAVATQQLFLQIQPDDPDEKTQSAWYSMGGK